MRGRSAEEGEAGLVEDVSPDEDALGVEAELRVVGVAAEQVRVDGIDVPRAGRVVRLADRDPVERCLRAGRRHAEGALDLEDGRDEAVIGGVVDDPRIGQVRQGAGVTGRVRDAEEVLQTLREARLGRARRVVDIDRRVDRLDD